MPNDYEYGRHLSETDVAERFESEFPAVTGRTVEILEDGEAPDRIALIDGVTTGIELTAIKAGNAGDIVYEIGRLANKKHASYDRRRIFEGPPIILLGHLDWPAIDVEGVALYDVYIELKYLFDVGDFEGLGFSEIWLMDAGIKYSSRKHRRYPADFYCFFPDDNIGFWEHERKRSPYWARLIETFWEG
jgi:hypothetical protein